MSAPAGSPLAELAERMGILPGYVGVDGRYHETGVAAKVAALAVLGIQAKNDRAARAALRALAKDEPAATRIVRCPFEIDLHDVPRVGGRLVIEAEDGSREERDLPPRARAMRITDLAHGVFRLRVEAGEVTRDELVVVAPQRCLTYEERCGKRRRFGIWCNLYSLRGGGPGIGTLSDLLPLLRLAARTGAAFVGISPLHAARNRWHDISPYSGLSRIYRNTVYLDVTAAPELASSARARELLATSTARIEDLQDEDAIDYEAVAGVQAPIIAALSAALDPDGDSPRARALREFTERDGGLVRSWGTFLALCDAMFAAGHGVDWRSWPEQYRDPRSAAVQQFATDHEAEVRAHVYAQFELERQLDAVCDAAADVELGLYQDLALGSSISGFDAWAFPGLFLEGANLGAPPDPYAATGQDWGIPPLDPRTLARDGYRYLRLVLRQAMQHAGVLRIDHAMGLLRQYWVPRGEFATSGCYVRYPVDDLLAVIALGSRQHGCLVVGEDLGTVPEGFAELLARAGVLSSRVMLFERGARDSFKAASRYSRRALVTANTHDHATLVGWTGGRDIEIRRDVGQLSEDEAEQALRAREREVRALRKRVGAPGDDDEALCAAVYSFLATTPSPLVGVSVDDLAGEVEPANVPGLSQDSYPSWRRRMSTPVDQLVEDPGVVRILEGVARARRRRITSGS